MSSGLSMGPKFEYCCVLCLFSLLYSVPLVFASVSFSIQCGSATFLCGQRNHSCTYADIPRPCTASSSTVCNSPCMKPVCCTTAVVRRYLMSCTIACQPDQAEQQAGSNKVYHTHTTVSAEIHLAARRFFCSVRGLFLPSSSLATLDLDDTRQIRRQSENRMVQEFPNISLGFVLSCEGFGIRSTNSTWRQKHGVGATADSRKNCALTINSNTATRKQARSPFGVTQMSIREMIGADVESGGLFDPLGFSKDEPSLFRRRAVELKHGRVAMLAVTGILVQSFVRFPGFPPCPVSNPARPLAVLKGILSNETNSVLLFLLVIGAVELTIGKQDYVDRAPGELGDFGAFAKPVDMEEWDKVQMAELKHGRLAMLGVVGCLVQELVTGQGPVEQLLLGNISPFT